MGCGIKNHDGSKRTSPIKHGDRLVYNPIVQTLVLEDEHGQQLKWNGSLEPLSADFIITQNDFSQLASLIAAMFNLKPVLQNDGNGNFQANFRKNTKTRLK